MDPICESLEDLVQDRIEKLEDIGTYWPGLQDLYSEDNYKIRNLQELVRSGKFDEADQFILGLDEDFRMEIWDALDKKLGEFLNEDPGNIQKMFDLDFEDDEDEFGYGNINFK